MTLAFLQNQWFHDPIRMEKMLNTIFKGNRELFIRTWLFYSCMTGKRLRSTFGEEQCMNIIWEEASPKMGGKSDSAYPADHDHIMSTIAKHNPKIVLGFGKIACNALVAIKTEGKLNGIKLLIGPHPVARGDTIKVMRQMNEEYINLLAALTNT